MIRLDYGAGGAHRTMRAFRQHAGGSLRRPLAALGSILTVCACVHAAELGRYRSAMDSQSLLMQQLRDQAPVLARVDAARAGLERRVAGAAAIAALRRANLKSLDRIAAIGNTLPASVSLTIATVEPLRTTVQGHSPSLLEVIRFMQRLVDDRHAATIRLVSAREDRAQRGVTFSIALDGDA